MKSWVKCSILVCAALAAIEACPTHAQQLETARLNGYLYAAAVSPDGGYVVANTLRSVQNPDGSWDNAESVQVFESAGSMKQIKIIDLPSAQSVKDAPLGSGGAFVSYCDDGKYLVAYDKNGKLYVVDPSSYGIESVIELGLGDLHPHGVQGLVTIACSASSSLIAVAAHGGQFGLGLVKLFELTSGQLVAELNRGSFPAVIGAMSISPSGSKLAILFQNAEAPSKPIEDPNVGVYETTHLRVLNRFSTGDAAQDLILSGDSEAITLQGAVQSRNGGKRGLRVWNIETGKEERRLFDASRDVQDSISASLNGDRVLGYIPEIHNCLSCGGLEGQLQVKEQRFAVWDTRSGMEVFRSAAFGPILRSFPFQPHCTLSPDGNYVLVYWPSTEITPHLIPVH